MGFGGLDIQGHTADKSLSLIIKPQRNSQSGVGNLIHVIQSWRGRVPQVPQGGCTYEC